MAEIGKTLSVTIEVEVNFDFLIQEGAPGMGVPDDQMRQELARAIKEMVEDGLAEGAEEGLVANASVSVLSY